MNKQEDNNKCDLKSICNRLHRINGQVTAVERMLNEKSDFTAILQQLVAARTAMDKVAGLVLESEARGCLSNKNSNLATKELSKIVATFFKVT
ncbi:MAG: metal-sensitive transcriptional regulator [Candidatus Kerfeldbacteria bacterium]|jgi:CsoR family transcriptional regulator, copper-sensing transcriptional repressor